MLDVFSRRVIGWAMSSRCDELLVETALRMALARRQPTAGLLHHTDRGSQYTSRASRQLLEQVEITVSMSGKGNWQHPGLVGSGDCLRTLRPRQERACHCGKH